MSNPAGDANTVTKPSNSGGNNFVRRPIVRIAVLFLGIAGSCFLLYKSTYPFQFLQSSFLFSSSSSFPPMNRTSQFTFDINLERVLKNASTADKTVILTTLNQAWAKPQSLLDIFLGSFKMGNDTERLLNHLVIVSMDQKAHNRCLSIHPHCYALKTEGVNFSSEAHFMSESYIQMMWRRIDFLASVLGLGYNFVFTDTDIVWLQNPFPRFYPDGDFQIACDRYSGDPDNKKNQPNGGLTHVKSNIRSFQFYKFWHASRLIYPGLHDQDVLNRIKFHPFIESIGLKMKFLDTKYFGGFCEPSKDLNVVCTMHANCCIGMENKIHDLKLVLDDWKKFMSLPQDMKVVSHSSWRAPEKCR